MSRDDERAANRARWPWLADMAAETGGKVLWAQDEAGEIGRRPPLERGLVEIDLTHESLWEYAAWVNARKRK